MQNANEAIGQTTDKIRKANKKADQLITRVNKADKDLVQLIQDFKTPSQCCLNITLVLMVLALIGVIINLIKGSTV
jgi:predicted ribonuclease toxin of YeeF-YezG toxin-antitoxin module